MASPEVLDFERLLAPVPGENPAGEDLRNDLAHDSVYRQIRAAREKAREAERRHVYADEDEQDVPRGDPPDWKPLLKLAPNVIAEQSKDLELAAILTEALVRKHGYAGLRDGFRLLRELVDRYWDQLYPLPDEEGVIARVAPLVGLNGEERDGVLISPIYQVPITEGKSQDPFNVLEYRRAIELDAIQDPERRARLIAQPGVVTKAMFDAAEAEASPQLVQNLLDDISACLDEFRQLGELLEEKCGQDESGYPLAPPSSNIRNALRGCEEDVRTVYVRLLEVAALEEAGDGEMISVEDAGNGILNQMRTREEAFQALLRAADFFKRSEPHSPVSYALEQAVRWGRMSLPDLLTELVTDESVREQLFKMVGIKLPEENE